MLGMLAAISLALVACGESPTLEGPDASGSPKRSALPVFQFDDCTTAQGDTPPAAPKGVDFKTQLRDPGTLLVGSDNDFPPFESIEPGADEPEGFDVDLYREVAKRLGVKPNSKTVDFDGLFTDSVPDGEVDVGISAITIKEERKKTVDFTVPYFEADLSVAINNSRTPEIKGVADLAGKTVAVQEGTTGADCADALKADGKIGEVKKFDDTSPAFQDLDNGRVAAVINDRPASEGFVKRNSDFEVVEIIRTTEQYGFAVSKDKPDLREAINEQLTAIMEDGTYATIYEKWFGTPPPFDVPID